METTPTLTTQPADCVPGQGLTNNATVVDADFANVTLTREVVQVVKNVGNYGEIFERTLGTNSDLKLARGLNNTWTKGGLMYSMPFR